MMRIFPMYLLTALFFRAIFLVVIGLKPKSVNTIKRLVNEIANEICPKLTLPKYLAKSTAVKKLSRLLNMALPLRTEKFLVTRRIVFIVGSLGTKSRCYLLLKPLKRWRLFWLEPVPIRDETGCKNPCPIALFEPPGWRGVPLLRITS